MKNISISTFINIIFTITLFAIIGVYYIFVELDKQTYKINQENRYELLANSFLTKFKHNPTNEEIKILSKKLNLTLLNDREKNIEILNIAMVLYKKESLNFRIRVFEYKNKLYLYIQSIGYNLMFEMQKIKNYLFIMASVIFAFILSLIAFIYIIIMKKIKPLKILHQKIQLFSQGDLTVKLDIDSKDEIGQISKSFNEAMENINQLVNSKSLFMKNIIHELKTPITKGLFLANMIQTEQKEDKELLIKNFNTLNSIINQLSNIEKLKTHHLQITKENIDIDGTIKQIIMMLDIKENIIQIKKDSTNIIANKDLFGTLLKNLVHNGIKYSSNTHIEIEIKKDKLYVKSKGDKLLKPLNHYTQPFVQEKRNSEGFGLGLYLVNEISNIHNFKLLYKYEDGHNIFYIDLKS